MRRLRYALSIGVAAVLALASQTPDLPSALHCHACPLHGAALRDLLVGVGLLGGLVWAMYWLETAPLRSVALNLAGVAAAVAALIAVAGG